MTEWSEVDLLTCFETEPEVGEDRLSFTYVAERYGYRLTFTIWPYDEDVYISLHGPSQTLPLVELWLHSCTAVRYGRSGEIESLAFTYRDLERLKPLACQCVDLRVRPDFAITMTR